MDSISQDVARQPTRRENIRRHLAPVAAAAALVIASVAISVTALNRPSPIEEASARLDQATTITDVRERLTVLIEVYETTRTLPAPEGEQVAADLAGALSDTIDDVKDEGTPGDEDLIDEAESAVEDLQSGNPPEPPPAPGQEQGPIETLKDTVEDGP